MGQTSAHQGLEEAKRRAEGRVGKISISGRYHKDPNKALENDYVLSPKVLGSGANGDVVLAQRRYEGEDDGGQYAVKAFKLTGLSLEEREHLQEEVEVFLSLDHPHIARLVDVYESENQLSLVMECMDGGELFQRITEHKKFTERNAADATWQMLLAINYLHQYGIVHRDLKLENFLFQHKDSNHLKLIDFGLSKVWEHNTKLALSCGTLSYVAPEVLSRSYTSQCDMWSLGVIAFILLVGYRPFFGSEAKQINAIMSGKYKYKRSAWSKVSKVAFDFVQKLLVVNPNVRLTAAQALEHPWIKRRDDMLKENSVMDADTVSAMLDFAHSSCFRRACLSVMAWSLTSDETKKVRDAFLELDVERKGSIQLWEMQKVLEDQFHVDHDEVGEIFKRMDCCHHDEIHYSEFLAAMVSTRIHLHDFLLKDTFRRFDLHNSGYITKDDVQEVFGDSFDGEEIGKMLVEAGFESEGKIFLEEFMAFLKSPNAVGPCHEAAHRIIDHEILRQDGASVDVEARAGPWSPSSPSYKKALRSKIGQQSTPIPEGSDASHVNVNVGLHCDHVLKEDEDEHGEVAADAQKGPKKATGHILASVLPFKGTSTKNGQRSGRQQNEKTACPSGRRQVHSTADPSKEAVDGSASHCGCAVQ